MTRSTTIVKLVIEDPNPSILNLSTTDSLAPGIRPIPRDVARICFTIGKSTEAFRLINADGRNQVSTVRKGLFELGRDSYKSPFHSVVGRFPGDDLLVAKHFLEVPQRSQPRYCQREVVLANSPPALSTL